MKESFMLLSVFGATNMMPNEFRQYMSLLVMGDLLQQLKHRRLEMGLKQNDMMLRIGVSRQQYQRLESKGNPRLDTLELVAKGLNSEIMLIPSEKLRAVMDVLEGAESREAVKPESTLSVDPWKGLLDPEQ
jgi:transcriptional regulator with XRE-family HTH domain